MTSESWRRQPLPRGWYTIRRNILKRDGYACQWPEPFGICAAAASDVDHVDPEGSQTDPANLRSLCRAHHKRKSSREGGIAAQARKPRQRRPPEAHPGLLPATRRTE